jgi:copper(I)-binding protein
MKKVAIALALVSSLALSGCATGFNAGTNTQGNSGSGRTANVGNIQVRGAILVVDTKNPNDASLVATFINTADTADTLTSLDIAEPANGIGTSVALAPNKAVSLGYNSDVAVTFTTTGEPLVAGHFVDVTFKFANNESIKLSLLVVANTGEYKDVTIPSTLMSVTPSPTPSAS